MTVEEAKQITLKLFAEFEGQIVPFVAELRKAQSEVDSSAYDYGDKQKGQAADIIEQLLAHIKSDVEKL